MLLQSLRALCFAPGGTGSIWNYLGAPVRCAGVSGRFACGFWTDLHFADVMSYCQGGPCECFISPKSCGCHEAKDGIYRIISDKLAVFVFTLTIHVVTLK